MRNTTGLVFSALLAVLTSPAQAQAPVGTWTTDDGGETLVVQPNGQCTLRDSNGYVVAGACSWNVSGNGGTLTIMNAVNQYPTPANYSVMWVDQGTITVQGDILEPGLSAPMTFHRQQ